MKKLAILSEKIVLTKRVYSSVFEFALNGEKLKSETTVTKGN